VSKVSDYPKSYRQSRMPWVFRSISKLWYTDKTHYDTCRCDECALGGPCG
jgi:hypothetical protein